MATVASGSNEIGFELSRPFTEEVAAVVTLAREAAKLKAKAMLLEHRGLKLLPIPAHVGCTDDVRKVLQLTLRQYGPPGVQLNRM